ncbi:MAG TPA: hypothetical protein VLB81_14440 [Gaiellales bacterium]|nr:hypothetical protein [Gaiellales bacterium]
MFFIIGGAIGASGGTTTTRTQHLPANTVTNNVTDTQTVTETNAVVHRVVVGAPNHGVKINYGEWNGLFKLTGARITSDGFGDYSVAGQLTYLGGGTCKLGYVEVSGTFFQGKRITDASGLWNSETAPAHAALPFDMSYSGPGAPTGASLVVTAANRR